LIDHFDAGAEDENQQEYRDITRREERLLKIAGSTGWRPWRLWLKIAEKEMVYAGEASVKDEQAQYDDPVDKEFLMVQPFRYEQVSVEIVKGDQQDIVQDKKGGEIAFSKE
jgi:hypothetical protein